MIPYPRFTKLIVSHYMTTFRKISRRARDRYHNLADDVMIKSIFNSGKIEVFEVDVPTTQSQPIESTQVTHRTTIAHRTPNPEIAKEESSAPRSREELEATQNVEKVKEHLMAEEIKKLVEGTKNVKVNVEPRSDKERPKVEKIIDISQPVNVIEEEEESVEDDYELKRREKGKEIEESRNTSSPTTTRSLRTHSTLISLDTNKL
ncbi:hypothetical protein Tco_1031951 [Tanacetum coccineum]|uniref:Uncharacterized protein n=1 Tax=Tanacetum coccineum TaxID=301880 RepID=A0ABQ5GAF9_9ASTR